MPEKEKRAAQQAVIEATGPGVTRSRALEALGSARFDGEPFVIWLNGATKKQKELALRTLKNAGVIELAKRSERGRKAQYRMRPGFFAPSEGAAAAPQVPSYDETTELHDALMGDFWKHRLKLGPTAPTLAGGRYGEIWSKVEVLGLNERGGKLGEAIQAVVWALSTYPEGISFEELPTETDEEIFSERTLKQAIRLLREAGLLETIGAGRSPRTYRYPAN